MTENGNIYNSNERNLVRFIPYEEYYGSQIYPIILRMSLIGIAAAIILTIQSILFDRFEDVLWEYLICIAVAIVFISLMGFFSVFRGIPCRKRINLVIISGYLSQIIFVYTNITVLYSFADVIITCTFYLLSVIIMGPILRLKVFVIANSIMAVSAAAFLVACGIDYVETIKILIFLVVSAIFVGLILKYLKRSFVSLYESALVDYLHSNLDTLTRILNRRAWYEHSEKRFALHPREMTAFIMLDIDHFKKINDTYGHLCGDAVLKKTAEILLSSTRDTDIIGRLGGEEFGVLLRIESREEALVVAERIRQSVKNLVIEYESHSIKITISCGLAYADGSHFEDLIKRSDHCLYKAKSAGRDRVVSE